MRTGSVERPIPVASPWRHAAERRRGFRLSSSLGDADKLVVSTESCLDARTTAICGTGPEREHA
eukprot:167488-Chlamydomonas_euryale.AAC.1